MEVSNRKRPTCRSRRGGRLDAAALIGPALAALRSLIVDSLRSEDLDPEDLAVLQIVSSCPATSVGSIARKLGWELPTCSARVERLVTHDLVEKSRNRDNRRQIDVVATSNGVQKLAELQQLLIKSFERMRTTEATYKSICQLGRADQAPPAQPGVLANTLPAQIDFPWPASDLPIR